MSDATPGAQVEVRAGIGEDVCWAPAAADLIEEASREYDIATREVAWLEKKIVSGRAALAIQRPDGGPGTEELVGFGYWSDWEDGKFISHSGLVVRPDMRGHHIGRRLKQVLFDSSRARFPEATLMSLTTSPEVKAMNLSLGFQVVPLDRLTKDTAFWEGCKTCRNFEEVQRQGLICCCEGMILEP